ncbi:alpha-amylase family protein [Novipirellula artificiosorum]|uniref:Alpha-L-fucosidase n=1 Tax=Novipirellula artificiosorum TaxID=2528016 RepID=A0A5C6DSS2_9BACT|nr:alpha-L-fucosidase [Novipirellula artificiosorum]TWU39702.1 Alpha-L-fucosidase [Novipirellula artificiosorum]
MNRLQNTIASGPSHEHSSCSDGYKKNTHCCLYLKCTPLLLLLFITPAFAQDVDFGSPERVKPFEGTWGIRILLPTSQDQKALDDFDVPAFIDQVTQLKSISYVMINLHNGHYGSYHNAPHPELRAVLGRKHFPDRDLFGEVADALVDHDLKVLVYFSSPAFDWAEKYVPDRSIKAVWEKHIQSQSMSHWDAVSKLIVKHYSDQYRGKISGWWFDRTKRTIANAPTTDAEYQTLARAARSGNPNSIVAFHYRVGPVNRGTRYCDYTAGHPHPMAYSKGPWDNVNLRMVTAIENGPYIQGAFVNDQAKPTATPDQGTLGHIFMPFQRNWKNGDPNFPTDQALDWMTRVVNAGGFYTWAVARNGGLFAEPQFQQLLEMDAAMEQDERSVHGD